MPMHALITPLNTPCALCSSTHVCESHSNQVPAIRDNSSHETVTLVKRPLPEGDTFTFLFLFHESGRASHSVAPGKGNRWLRAGTYRDPAIYVGNGSREGRKDFIERRALLLDCCAAAARVARNNRTTNAPVAAGENIQPICSMLPCTLHVWLLQNGVVLRMQEARIIQSNLLLHPTDAEMYWTVSNLKK